MGTAFLFGEPLAGRPPGEQVEAAVKSGFAEKLRASQILSLGMEAPA
jgi:hypothetical protein